MDQAPFPIPSRAPLRHVPAPDFYGDPVDKTRLIFEAAPDAIIGTDRSGRIIFWNPQAEALFGWEHTAMIGAPLVETLFGPHLHPQLHSAFDRYFTTGDSSALGDRMELTALGQNGQQLPVALYIRVIREAAGDFFCAFIRERPEPRENGQRACRNEQRFSSLVQNASDMIAILDEAGGYLYASPSVTAILGYAAADFGQRHISEFIHPDDIERVQQQFLYLLQHDKVVVSPYRFRRADGSWCWIESYGTNLLQDTAIRGLVINSHDVTDRIRLQEELERQARALQKEMTAAVIHAQESERSQLGQELHDNVNQVLTTIKLYLEMIRDGFPRPEDLLGRSIDNLQDCINEIRSISKRLSAPTLGSISLSDSLRELVDAVNLTGRIAVRHCIEGTVDRDISRDVHLALYRIIQEALNNIVKYAAADSAAILLSRRHDHLNLQIYDNGCGFDIATRNGGIGITNMRSRAEHLNGTFRIESTPGKGTVIKVSIPLR